MLLLLLSIFCFLVMSLLNDVTMQLLLSGPSLGCDTYCLSVKIFLPIFRLEIDIKIIKRGWCICVFCVCLDYSRTNEQIFIKIFCG